MNLKKWLDENNRTQAWLANEVGVKPPSVNLWVANNVVPPKRVRRVAEITGLKDYELCPEFFSK